MKEFDVTITETLKLTVSVEASSKEEAQQMLEKRPTAALPDEYRKTEEFMDEE